MKTTAFSIAYFPRVAWAIPVLGAATLIACSQTDMPTPPPPAAAPARAGAARLAGGSTAGTSASAGSGGSSAARPARAARQRGHGGTARWRGCVFCPIPRSSPRTRCALTFPSQAKGDTTFKVTSDDFTSCGEMPKAMTCDGNDFGTGASPAFKWTAAPAGTLSFAVVFKDISLLNDLATERFGYHWVMWDIPPTTTGLPGAMKGGYDSMEVPGAHQWSSLTSYGFFTPCPNPFPKEHPASVVPDAGQLFAHGLRAQGSKARQPAASHGHHRHTQRAGEDRLELGGEHGPLHRGTRCGSPNTAAPPRPGPRPSSRQWRQHSPARAAPVVRAAPPVRGRLRRSARLRRCGRLGAGGSSAGGAGGSSAGGSSAGGAGGSSAGGSSGMATMCLK